MPFQVTSKFRPPWHVRRIGKADGFSEDYEWNAENHHTVTMDDGDVDLLRQVYPVDADEFRFSPVQAQAAEPAPKQAKGAH